jgi:hypothetical protein
MNWFRKLFKLLLIVSTMSQITACAKTVKWEEEVLLNTGEIIWVTKEVNYSIKGQPGNPLDLGYVPDFVETTSFKYRDRDFKYTGAAKIILLAISPENIPVLLARPTSNDWYRNNDYKCVVPYYVQFVPDQSGQVWTWPKQVGAWTYNLPANLYLNRPTPAEIQKRYTAAEKANHSYMRNPKLVDTLKINPLYVSDHCKGRIKP